MPCTLLNKKFSEEGISLCEEIWVFNPSLNCSQLTEIEEIQTEERNHARFSMWHGACVHVACLSYHLIANANCEVFLCKKVKQSTCIALCMVYRPL